MSITMALMFRVPTAVRCCMMPARMASFSPTCFLQPVAAKSMARSAVASANGFISRPFFTASNIGVLTRDAMEARIVPPVPCLYSITHEQGDGNVQNGEDGEGVTK